jgi:hypothetical protein
MLNLLTFSATPYCKTNKKFANNETINLGQHIIVIKQQKTMPIKQEIDYAIFDSTFLNIENKDTLYLNLKIYEVRTYKKFIDSSRLTSLFGKYEIPYQYPYERLDSNILEFDSLFNVTFYGANYRIITMEKLIYSKTRSNTFFCTAIDNDSKCCKIKLFNGFYLNYVIVSSIKMVYKSKSNNLIDWADYFWFISE